jgi:hypothetical protein
MNRSFLLRALLVLSVLAVGVPACTTHESDSIRPQAALSSTLTVADARSWYQAQAGPLQTAAAARGSSPTQTVSGPLPIDWAHAVDTTADAHAVVFAPVRDFGRRFTDAGYQTSRYLVVTRSGPTQPTGMVVEVFLKDAHQPSKARERALLARLYTHHRSAANTLPGNFTGHAFFYSADYRYLTGTGYAKGKALAGTMRLTRAVPVTAAPAKKQSTANKTTGCTTYLIKGGTADAYYEEICGTEPDFGNLDPGQPGFFDPGYGGAADAPITGGGTTGGGTSPTNILVINTSQLKPCEVAVMNTIKGLSGDPLLTNLQKLAGTTPGYNWTVKDGALVVNQNAFTSSGYDTNTNSVITTFDLQKFSAITDLSIARTMLHESFHAYLVAYFANDRVLANAEYSAMVDAYQIQHQSIQDVHHVEMAFWVDNIADALSQYGQSKGYSLPSQFYHDMAWAGLETTQAYKDLSSSDKKRIQDTILTELTGNDSNGNSAIQSGKSPGC